MTRMMRVWCLTGDSTGFGRALATLVFVAGVVAGAPMLAQAQAPRSPTPAPVPGAARVGTLFVTQGERFDHRDQAQDRSSDLGKIVRLHPDGSVPRDNPFVGRDGVRPEIWSYDHCNIQSAALHPQTGQLWTVEHGGRGGDELNRVEAGKNYGWPVLSYGVHYSGAKIGEGTSKPGMEQPVYYWDPVIAPSGMAFYTGEAFPEWQGSLLISSLQPGLLVRLTLEDGRVIREDAKRGTSPIWTSASAMCGRDRMACPTSWPTAATGGSCGCCRQRPDEGWVVPGRLYVSDGPEPPALRRGVGRRGDRCPAERVGGTATPLEKRM